MWVSGWPASFLAVTWSGLSHGATFESPKLAPNRAVSSPFECYVGVPSQSWRQALAKRSRTTSRRRREQATCSTRQRRHRLAESVAIEMGVAADDGKALDSGKISLWLDMRTAVLPAKQTLQRLYDDLRERELARGRSPDDEDWTLRRVPDPIGALVYADKPDGRAKEEFDKLEGALRCFEVDVSGRVTRVDTDDVVGVGLDPAAASGDQGPSFAVNAAVQGVGELVLLLAVRPSCWANEDIPSVLRVAAGACTGAGKTLVVTIRTTGQLHEAAMAALSASQTTILGGAEAGGGVALLLEPIAELWEAGMLYLQ